MPWAKIKLSKGAPLVSPPQFSTGAQDDSLHWLAEGGGGDGPGDEEEAAAAEIRAARLFQVAEAREHLGTTTSQVLVGTDLCYEAPLQLRSFALATGISGPCGHASGRFWKSTTGSVLSTEHQGERRRSIRGKASLPTSSLAASSFANPAGQLLSRKVQIAKKDTHIAVGHCRTKLEMSRFIALLEDCLNSLSSATIQTIMDLLCDVPIISGSSSTTSKKELPLFVSLHAVPVSPAFHCTAQVTAKSKAVFAEKEDKTSLPKECTAFPHSTPTNSVWMSLNKLLNTTLKALNLGEPDEDDEAEAKKRKEPPLERVDALSFVALYTASGVACCNHQFLYNLNHRDRMVVSILALGTQKDSNSFLREVPMQLSGRANQLTNVLLLHLTPTVTLAVGVPKSMNASSSAVGFTLLGNLQSKISNLKSSGLAQDLLEEDAAGNNNNKKKHSSSSSSSGGLCCSTWNDTADSSGDALPTCRLIVSRIEALCHYEQSCITSIYDQGATVAGSSEQVHFLCGIECEDSKEKKPTRFLMTSSQSAMHCTGCTGQSGRSDSSSSSSSSLPVVLQSQLIIAKQQLGKGAGEEAITACGTSPGHLVCGARLEPVFAGGKKAPARDKAGEPIEDSMYALSIGVTLQQQYPSSAATQGVEEMCGDCARYEFAGEYSIGSGKAAASTGDKARSLHAILASVCHGCGML